jgi:uncharacterized protein YecT (DUF1311 family)
MMRLALSALAFLALIATGAANTDCSTSTGQQDMNACRADSFRRTDEAMSAAYKDVLTDIGPQAREALQAAQEAWLAYRKTTCSLEEMGSKGGSIQPLIYYSCMERITSERRDRLKAYYECEDNDPSCVSEFKD